jgi:hypothetical protein
MLSFVTEARDDEKGGEMAFKSPTQETAVDSHHLELQWL